MATRRKPTAAAKRKDKERGLTNNALVAGVVSAVVAGVISLLVTHFQDRSAESQAHSAQQASAAEQLEAAASSLYSATQNVYNFQRGCVSPNVTWKLCAAQAPYMSSFSAAFTAFGPAVANEGDPQAGRLANQFSTEAAATVGAADAAHGEQSWNNFLNTYVDLIARCGQLIRG